MQIICNLYLLMKLELLKFCCTSIASFRLSVEPTEIPPGALSNKLSSSKKIFASDMQIILLMTISINLVSLERNT